MRRSRDRTPAAILGMKFTLPKTSAKFLSILLKCLLNAFLPRDAMRKRGLCRPVSVCPSVTFVYQESRRLKMSNCFLLDPAHHSSFLSRAPIPISNGSFFIGALNTQGVGENLLFSTDITVYLGNGTR